MTGRTFICAAAALLAAAVLAAQAAAQSPQPSAEALFIEAQKALARGDTDGAELLLRDAFSKDPSFVSAIWQLAQIQESRGRLDQARELLERGLSIDPRASWARERLAQLDGRVERTLLAEARAAMGGGDYRRASAKLGAYLAMKPGDASALAAMARCQLELGNVKSAESHLERARSADPANREAAELAAEIGRRRRAERVDRLVSEARRELAAGSQERPEAARAALRAVLDEDPGHAWANEELRLLDERIDAEERRSPRAESPPETAPDTAAAASADVPHTGGATGAGRLIAAMLAAAAAAAAGGALAILVRRRKPRPAYPLEGAVSLVPLLDVVAFLSVNLRTGLLGIAGAEISGEIYFDRGEIIHARCADLSGMPAFHRLMGIPAGRFFFQNHLPTTRRTIEEPLSMLLLSSRPRENATDNPAGPAKAQQPAGSRR